MTTVTAETSVEPRQLRRIAREYRDRGYDVAVHPTRDLLPGRLADFAIDLLARSATETVVVQLKRQPHLDSAPRLDLLAREVEKHPGWRLDLVVLGRRRPDKHQLLAAVLDRDAIRARVESAERLLASGETEAALLLAWSAVEAALRRRAAHEDTWIKEDDPVATLNQLHFDGLLTTDQYFTLRAIAESRNAIVHGRRTTPVDRRVVLELTEIAKGTLEAA